MTNCRLCCTRNMPPIIAMKATVVAVAAAVSCGDRRMARSSIGAAARRSLVTKPASSSTDTVKPPMIGGDVQP